ncbi:MAG: pitrilysin family protein [Myxococcota bacterium]
MKRVLVLVIASALGSFAACGGSSVPEATVPPLEPRIEPIAQAPPTKVAPPESGPARDIAFPPIQRAELGNGLELNTVEWHQLPVVYLRLVVRSGAETDPENLQGLSDLVAQMLEEGTRRQSSAQLAERVEFLGADLWTGADEENVHLVFRALSEHLDDAMSILAEVATQPAFNQQELNKLKRRERDRLALMSKRPNFLARRAFYRRLYGDHPYGRVDTTEEVIQRVRRTDLVRWHRRHFVPSNSFLVAVGDVTPAQVQASATRAFGRWSGRAVTAVDLPDLTRRETREVVVVDRPGAVQSVILLGNLGIERRHEDYINFMVANQVLGGSAASRLFMDLRERRSLTYGAYSQLGDRVGVAPFVAYASVRTEVTGQAVEAFFENFDRIVEQAPPQEELRAAQRFLSDSFPLQIDTPGKIASMVADLRIFGLEDDYWTSFRTSIGEVAPAESLASAQRHIRPDKMLVLVVGEAAAVAQDLRRWGPVTVVDGDGTVIQQLDAQPEGAGSSEQPSNE